MNVCFQNLILLTAKKSSTMLIVLFASVACQNDECIKLCADVEQRVETCIDKWPTDWEHLDSNNADEFRESCQNEWIARSEQMEVRERQQAKDQCQETIIALEEEEDNCVLLRSVYFYDP
jgi:hypothetical protein